MGIFTDPHCPIAAYFGRGLFGPLGPGGCGAGLSPIFTTSFRLEFQANLVSRKIDRIPLATPTTSHMLSFSLKNRMPTTTASKATLTP